jgi:hypothetical protein
MKKAELSSRLRDYVRSQVSPTQAERDLVTKLYAAVRDCLGETCYLVGSFARFTASRPMHDIDVLFVAGEFNAFRLDPGPILERLQQKLSLGFRNPTSLKMEISKQTHSITICFLENNNERFGIDVVPGFISGRKNEFNHDIYWVPEILTVSKRNRRAQYAELAKRYKREFDWWITSDPRGYISEAANLNALNADFRHVTKLVKKWKHNCTSSDKQFALKSFHVEQAIANVFRQRPQIDISDALFRVLCDIPDIIARPQIPDRADSSRFIDEYVRGFSGDQTRTILEARDFFLIQLENISDRSSVSDLVRGHLHTRASKTEEYLFDQRIPILTEEEASLRITAYVLPRAGFRPCNLDSSGIINVDRKIEFSAKFSAPYSSDLLKWKVKNDNSSPAPRGEITDHRTRRHPEETKYKGSHFVECYAIKDGRCVARAKQNVVLKSV